MYKTAVYTLVDGGITHQEPQINYKLSAQILACINMNITFGKISIDS